MAAIYSVFTSPHHTPMPNHLPTLIITPHGQPHNILYSYLHTDYNSVNYLLTPSPQGDLCVAKLYPPSRNGQPSSSASSSASHASTSGSRFNTVRCEASRDLRWTIENAGVRSSIYKIVNSDDTPLYQISKPNPNADFWTMFYFAYAGHQIPPRRVEFGKISKNPPEKGGGTRISITGKSEEEKKVWQTLGEGNEDCVEWVIACACLNLLDDEILKAAEKKAASMGPPPVNAPKVGPASSSSHSAQPPSQGNARPGPSTLQKYPQSSSSQSIPQQRQAHSNPNVPTANHGPIPGGGGGGGGLRPPMQQGGPGPHDRPRSAEPPRTNGMAGGRPGQGQGPGQGYDGMPHGGRGVASSSLPNNPGRGPDPRYQQQQAYQQPPPQQAQYAQRGFDPRQQHQHQPPQQSRGPQQQRGPPPNQAYQSRGGRI